MAQQIEIKSAAYLTMNEGSRRGLHLLKLEQSLTYNKQQQQLGLVEKLTG